MDVSHMELMRGRAHTTGSIKEILMNKKHSKFYAGTDNKSCGDAIKSFESDNLCSDSYSTKIECQLNEDVTTRRRRYKTEFSTASIASEESGIIPKNFQKHLKVNEIHHESFFDSRQRFLSPHTWRRQKTRSLPGLLDKPEKKSAESAYISRQHTINSSDKIYLGESLFSATRQPSLSSMTSFDDDEITKYEDGNHSSIRMYNVSSSSSLEYPVIKLAIVCKSASEIAAFMDYFTLLGKKIDKDFCEDDDSDVKHVLIRSKIDSYEFILKPCTNIQSFVHQDLTAYIVLFNEKENILNLKKVDPILSEIHKYNKSEKEVLLISYNQLNDVASSDEICQNHLAEETKHIRSNNLMKFTHLEFDILGQEQAKSISELMILNAQTMEEYLEKEWRSQRRATVINCNEAVDKRALFRRFFWRTFSRKSCENLLAL